MGSSTILQLLVLMDEILLWTTIHTNHPSHIFDPYAHVSRAMMSTIFSRLLFGNAYNGNAQNWYIDHMNALKKSGILKMIGDPMDDLLR